MSKFLHDHDASAADVDDRAMTTLRCFLQKKKVELIKPSLFPRKHEHLESLYFIKSTRNSETERKRKKKKKKKKKKEKWGFTFITWLYFTSCAASVCFIVFTESSPSDDFYVSLSI